MPLLYILICLFLCVGLLLLYGRLGCRGRLGCLLLHDLLVTLQDLDALIFVLMMREARFVMEQGQRLSRSRNGIELFSSTLSILARSCLNRAGSVHKIELCSGFRATLTIEVEAELQLVAKRVVAQIRVFPLFKTGHCKRVPKLMAGLEQACRQMMYLIH